MSTSATSQGRAQTPGHSYSGRNNWFPRRCVRPAGTNRGLDLYRICSGDSARAPRSCGIARALLSTPVTSVLIAKHGRSETTCGSRPRRPRGPAPRQRHSSHEPSPQNKKDSAETIRCPRGQSAYVMPILSHTVHPCGVILAIGSGPVTPGVTQAGHRLAGLCMMGRGTR